MVSFASLVFSGEAFKKARAKSLSNVSDRYNYYRITSKKDIENQQIGIDARDKTGFQQIINYGEISNVSIGSSKKNKTARPFNSSVLRRVARGNTDGQNLGVKANSKNRGKISNIVHIKNSKIISENKNGSNVGVKISGSNGVKQMQIDNTVSIVNSTISDSE